MKYKYTKEDAYEVGWPGLKGWAYSNKDDFKNASSIYFEVTGSHGKIKTTLNDRIYFVIDGEGVFIINDKEIPVSKSDVIIVPKNTPYDYKAQKGDVLKMFLVHIPAFEVGKQMDLE